MVEVLIIADDLTGAIDASAPFIGEDVTVKTDFANGLSAEALAAGSRILSVNANTRHLNSAEACARVKALVAVAKEAGVKVVLKKTDSVLRGNIGAELEGALAASGQKVAHFMPSFPKIGRVTTGGVHYINEVPVAESDLAHDPFEPVRHSAVCDILHETTPVSCVSVVEGAELSPSFEGIAVYDGTTDESLLFQVQALLAGGQNGPAPLLLAGCAGAGAALASALNLNVAAQPEIEKRGSTLAFCGSVNPVSMGQVGYAQEHGVPTINIAPAQILDISWVLTPEFDKLALHIAQKLSEHTLVVIDNSSKVTHADMAKAGISTTEELRARYAQNLGQLATVFLKSTHVENMLVMGGDILLSMLTCLEVDTCSLAAQIAPGVVVFEVEIAGRSVRLISKSGGFGEPDMFERVAELFSEPKSNEETKAVAKSSSVKGKEIA